MFEKAGSQLAGLYLPPGGRATGLSGWTCEAVCVVYMWLDVVGRGWAWLETAEASTIGKMIKWSS